MVLVDFEKAGVKIKHVMHIMGLGLDTPVEEIVNSFLERFPGFSTETTKDLIQTLKGSRKDARTPKEKPRFYRPILTSRGGIAQLG